MIINDDCGYFAYDVNATLEQRTLAMQSKDLNSTLFAATYARQCYEQNLGLDKLKCSSYTKQYIKRTSSETDCPFDQSICSAPKGFKLDSDLIDSHVDLGINAPHADRVGFRRVTTCSPLSVQEPYVSVITSTGNDSLGIEGDRIRKYQYGTFIQSAIDLNTTYLYNQHAFIDGYGYELRSVKFCDPRETSATIQVLYKLVSKAVHGYQFPSSCAPMPTSR